MKQQTALTIKYDDKEEQLAVGDMVELAWQEGRSFAPFISEVVRITPKRAYLRMGGYVTTRGTINGTGDRIIDYKGKQ